MESAPEVTDADLTTGTPGGEKPLYTVVRKITCTKPLIFQPTAQMRHQVQQRHDRELGIAEPPQFCREAFSIWLQRTAHANARWVVPAK